MARTNRSAVDAEWHHVMNRGARKLPVFGDRYDRERFLDALKQATERTSIEVHAYALMDNHFHLLVRAHVPDLSAGMKSIGSAYTQGFNAKYGLDGALFRGRFRSKPILNERYLQHVVRYVHRNPIPAEARNVARRFFRWTSHPAYLGEVVRPPWLTTDEIRATLGGLTSYRRVVENGIELGLEVAESHPELRARALLPSDIDRALGTASPMELQIVHTGGRGIRNPLRIAALILCREFTSTTAGELALRYGYRSPGSVSSALTRSRQRLEADPDFAALVENARRRLVVNFRQAS